MTLKNVIKLQGKKLKDEEKRIIIGWGQNGRGVGGCRVHLSPKTYPISEKVIGRKARGLQMEEIACNCQTFFSLLSGRRKQTRDIFFLLYTNLTGGFS